MFDKKVFNWWCLLLGFALLLMTSCQVVTPAPPLAEAVGAKGEIVNFMLDYIVKNEIEPMQEVIATAQPPLIEEAPTQSLLVFGTFSATNVYNYALIEAEQAWLYQEGHLTAQEDPKTAIETYSQTYLADPFNGPSIFQWGIYEFGIVSLTEDERKAEVYLSASCGRLCGHGWRFTLEKNGDQWEITNTEFLWIS